MPPKPYLGEGNLTPYPRREIARRVVWSCVQATLFRWSPRNLHAWRVHLLKLFGATIPEPGRVRIYPTAHVLFPWRLALQPRVMVGPRVNIYNIGPVALGYGVQLSQAVHLCAGSHDYRRWSMPLVALPIVVHDNVWIGAEAFVGPGVTIGELSVVGARSVVVKDLPARMVCAGHPCKPLFARPEPL